jgi:hypothetical protein
MEYSLPNGYVLNSFDEQEFLSFGGPWQANFKLNGFVLPDKYMLGDAILVGAEYCILIQVNLLGNWRKDVRFSIVIIDTMLNQLLKSKKDFGALSLIKIEDGKIYFSEVFNSQTDEATNFLEINDSNFIRIGDIPN